MMTTIPVYVCVLLPEFWSLPTVSTAKSDKMLKKANSCLLVQVLTSFLKTSREVVL